jgi:adhesin transport system membrane fusion protein
MLDKKIEDFSEKTGILKVLLRKTSISFKKILRVLYPQINSHAKIDQLRYLSQTALVEETIAPRIVRTILMIISTIILVLVGWSALTYVNEIATTEGEVLPSKHIQSIQHLEGGIVAEINVSEGELVEKGQVLIRLNGSGLEKDLGSLKAKKLSLQYQSLRLKSFINQTTPTFKEIKEGRNKEMEGEQLKAFQSMMKAKESERKVIEEQIAQKKESLEGLEEKNKTLNENIKLVSEERDLKKKLMEKGNLSRFNFLDIQKQLNQIRGELNGVDSDMSQAKNTITEYQNRLNSLSAKAIDEAYQELNQVDTDLAQVDEMIDKLSGQIERLDIKSPSYGYVKGVKVKTIGGIVEAGKVMLEVVPLEGDLVVETKIQPRDVGHIKLGQEVKVKISSYDFSRYGTVRGKLEYISATTFINDDGTRYYLGKVSLEKNYVGQDSARNLIIPGMTVEADIVTGTKTILAYLLKPIHTTVTTAFTER